MVNGHKNMNKNNNNNKVAKPQRKWTQFQRKTYWPFSDHIKKYNVLGKNLGL